MQEEVTETSLFDEKMLIYNVIDKTLTLADIDIFAGIYLKRDPATATQLRELYAQVIPGHHINTEHWDTVRTAGSIPDKQIYHWVDGSCIG